MLLSEYVDLTLPMVRNQMRLVDECGYCIAWTGDFREYDSVSDFLADIEMMLRTGFDPIGSVTYDISIDEAMQKYREE